MREIFTSGSVGRAPGNRCFYPEADSLKRHDFCKSKNTRHFKLPLIWALCEKNPCHPLRNGLLFVHDPEL